MSLSAKTPSDPVRVIDIKEKATEGLSGIPDSLSYRIAVCEVHMHSRHRILGLSSSPGSGRVASIDTLDPFVFTSGNNQYGNFVQILDENDTPVLPDKKYFDIHEYIINDLSNANPFKFQLAFCFGSETPAQAIALNQFTEEIVRSNGTGNDRGNNRMGMPRLPVGTRCYVRVWNQTNSATMKLWFSIHEYVG